MIVTFIIGILTFIFIKIPKNKFAIMEYNATMSTIFNSLPKPIREILTTIFNINSKKNQIILKIIEEEPIRGNVTNIDIVTYLLNANNIDYNVFRNIQYDRKLIYNNIKFKMSCSLENVEFIITCRKIKKFEELINNEIIDKIIELKNKNNMYNNTIDIFELYTMSLNSTSFETSSLQKIIKSRKSSKLTNNEILSDKEDIINEIIESIEKPDNVSHILLHGNPESGKTSTILSVLSKLENVKGLVINKNILTDEKLFYNLYMRCDFDKYVIIIDDLDKIPNNIFLNPEQIKLSTDDIMHLNTKNGKVNNPQSDSSLLEIIRETKQDNLISDLLCGILDGFNTKNNSKIIISTNRIELFNKELLRNGRITHNYNLK